MARPLRPKQLRALATSPRHMLRYRCTGRVPALVRPASPLIDLLEQLPAQARAHIRGVRLGPELGYRCAHAFDSAEALYRWLKPAEEMLEDEPFPAEQCRDPRFMRRLTLGDLRRCCRTWPEVMLRRRLPGLR